MNFPKPVFVFSDFDGTITDTDSLVFLTNHLGGGPELLESVRRRLRAETMSLRDAITEEMSSITARFETARELVKQRITRDPQFKEFASLCDSKSIPLTVLSAGFHELIELFVSQEEFPEIKVIASHVIPNETGWQCNFRDDSEWGTDKAAAIVEAREKGYHTVFIGDGLSDRASAAVADTVFAKRYLVEYCVERRIPHIRFESFADLLGIFDGYQN